MALSVKTMTFFDRALWALYLLLLIIASFITGPYQSVAWVSFSAAVYGLAALYFASLLFNGRCNWLALKQARVALLMLACMVIWLFLQKTMAFGAAFDTLVFTSQASPAWFAPDWVWSMVPERTHWQLLSQLMMAVLFILTVCMLDNRRRLRQFLWVVMLVGLTHALVGIVAKYAHLYLVDKESLDGHFQAARAWFVNRNHFGAFISLCLLGGLTHQLKEFIHTHQTRLSPVIIDQFVSLKLVFLLSTLVSVMAVVLSESRGAFLAFFVAFLVLVIMQNQVAIQHNDAFRKQRKYFMVATMVLLVLTLVYAGQGLLSRFNDNFLSIGERGTQWALTWQAIKAKWLLGYGAGSYSLVFQTVREYTDLRQVVFDQSHNDYLHIWLEQGLIGLLFWLVFIGSALLAAVCAMFNASSSLVRSVLMATLIVISAALIQSLVDFNLQIINIRYYFFAIIALCFAVPHITHRSKARQ